jgi:hypothetical protein
MPDPLKHTEEPWTLQLRTDNHQAGTPDVIVTASNWELIASLKRGELFGFCWYIYEYSTYREDEMWEDGKEEKSRQKRERRKM